MNPPDQPDPAVAEIVKKAELSGDPAGGAAISDVAGEDADDLAAAQAGDHAAFGRLYDRHAAVVLSMCRKRSLAEAEDATQETFIRAHRLLHKVKSPEQLRSWLFGVARRVCSERTRSARRRTKHEEGFAMSRAAETGAAARPASPAGPSQVTENAEQLERLGLALEKLDERERLAIHLYYLEADPVNAAMSALGLSRSGYYKLLGRARERLAELI